MEGSFCINNFNINQITRSVKHNYLCTCVQEADSSCPCTLIEDKTVLVRCTIFSDGWCSKRANGAHDLLKYIIGVFQRNVNSNFVVSWRYFRMKFSSCRIISIKGCNFQVSNMIYHVYETFFFFNPTSWASFCHQENAPNICCLVNQTIVCSFMHSFAHACFHSFSFIFQ